MNACNLQDFVSKTIAKNRITFGDVRRLARDYLPTGLLCREEAEILIALDAKLERTDRAWTDWLVAAVVDFVAVNEQFVGAGGTGSCEWLETLLATRGASEARRRITREIRRDIRRASQTPSLPWEENADLTPAVAADAAERSPVALHLAA
jgi:hypothetical protein